MPWAGGTFTRNNGTYSGSTVWQSDAAAAIKIRADRHDTHDQDIAQGINNCLTKDGQNSPTQHMSWGGFKLTNLGNGSATGDAVNFGQLSLKLDKTGGTLTGDLEIAKNLCNFSMVSQGVVRGYRLNSNVSDSTDASFRIQNLNGGVWTTGLSIDGSAGITVPGTITADGAISANAAITASGPITTASTFTAEGTITGKNNVTVQKDLPTLNLFPPSGGTSAFRWDIRANISDTVNGGVQIRCQEVNRMNLDSSGNVAFTGVVSSTGFRANSSFTITSVTVSSSAPGALAQGAIHFQY